MSTRAFLVIVVAIATMIAPLSASGATIRVTSAQQPLLGNLEWQSGSAPAYVTDTGTAAALPARNALGQLIAATAFTSTPLVVKEFSGLGPYVASIGTLKVGPKAAWMLYVNGRAAQVGAGSLTLKKQDRVLWVLDTDYAKAGPFVLDTQAVPRRDGTVLVRVTKIGGSKPVPAKGASIFVDNRNVGVADAKGSFLYVPPLLGGSTDWDTLQARQAGAIASQIINE